MENLNNPMNNNQVYEPVKCPHCGSTRIEFLTEYHRCIGLRVICIICAALFVFFFVGHLFSMPTGENREFSIAAMCIAGFFVVAFLIAVWITESKTHIQGICRDCGNIWLLN